MAWDGTTSNITGDLLLNGFYARLMHDCQPGGFTGLLEQRWNALRSGFITSGHIIGIFQQLHQRLAASGVYQREMLDWPDYSYQPADLDYISTWLHACLTYLDERFNAPCVISAITGPEEVVFAMQPGPGPDERGAGCAGSRGGANADRPAGAARTAANPCPGKLRGQFELLGKRNLSGPRSAEWPRCHKKTGDKLSRLAGPCGQGRTFFAPPTGGPFHRTKAA